MSGYVKDIILSEKSLEQAREYYKTHDWQEVWQYYNLFHLQRIDIPQEDYDLEFLKELHTYSRKSHNIGCYFLKYPSGSFTRIHGDNESEMTIVTMLDSNNLVGGECLVMGDYISPGVRPSDYQCGRHEGETKEPPYGKDIIPDIVNLDNGESMVYGPELRHGVTKVYEGERIVLIAWFKNGDRKRGNET